MLAPFFLALGVGVLEIAPTLDLAVVARLPLAPAAGGQEHADQKAEQEYECADRPQVGVGRDVHVASATMLELRRLRLSEPPRSNLIRAVEPSGGPPSPV